MVLAVAASIEQIYEKLVLVVWHLESIQRGFEVVAFEPSL